MTSFWSAETKKIPRILSDLNHFDIQIDSKHPFLTNAVSTQKVNHHRPPIIQYLSNLTHYMCAINLMISQNQNIVDGGFNFKITILELIIGGQFNT